MRSFDDIVAAAQKEPVFDDLSFCSTTLHESGKVGSNTHSVYFGRRVAGFPSEDAYLGEVERGQPPPPELALMLRCLSVGYRAGVRAGRRQVIAMSRLLAGGEPE